MASSKASTRSTAKFVSSVVLGATLACRVAYGENALLEGGFSNPNQSGASIKAAIDQAAKEINFVVRPIARSRLNKTNPVITTVDIGREGNLITVALNTGKPTMTEPGKPPVKWTRDDGETFDVSTAWHGAALAQTFSSADGKRENRYSLSADGATLTMRVTLTSEQLKAPMQYELTLRRD
jgi:hypothetical protein